MIMPFMLAPIIIVSFVVCAWAVSSKYNLLGIEYGGGRIGFLDGLRGLACVLVVCAHSKWVGSFGIADQGLTSFDYFFHTNMGSVGVQVFFCITGMLFFLKIIKSNGAIDFRGFYVSRFYRLAPLYIFWSIIVIAVCFSVGGLNVSVSDPREILKLFSFGFLGSDFTISGVRTRDFTTVIWSLAYEWKFYFVVPAIAALYAAKRKLALVLIFVCVAIFSDLLITGSSYVIYFLVGGAASWVYINTPAFCGISKWVCSIVSAAIFIACIYIDIPQYGAVRFVLIATAFLLIVSSRPQLLSVRPLVVLGEISYSVYLFHTLIIYILSGLLKWYLYPAESVASVVFVYSILSFSVFVVSAFTFKFIESPYMKRGRVVARNTDSYPVETKSRPV